MFQTRFSVIFLKWQVSLHATFDGIDKICIRSLMDMSFACNCSNGDQQVLMTEDHRLTSKDERLRLLESGKHLKDGENRLAGKPKHKWSYL
jgi:hypothetical protein